jgi:hypothetical protein
MSNVLHVLANKFYRNFLETKFFSDFKKEEATRDGLWERMEDGKGRRRKGRRDDGVFPKFP